MISAFIPSPAHSVWHIGAFPLRGYALCIVTGIIVCVMIGERRLVARGAAPGVCSDVAMWAVPFGIAGGRIYHVITTPGPYFGSGGDPVEALFIWKGGLGIWGAISIGGLGAYIGCRRAGILMPVYADAVAPGILVAQALGRFGNWFNQELYGKPTDLPWALEIDAKHRPPDLPDAATFHPTFLYESLWCLGVAALIVLAERRFGLGHGRVFALYVVGYTVGRGWIEALRIDEAHHIAGLRLNDWTSMLLFTGACVAFWLSARRCPGREPTAYKDGHRWTPPQVAEPGARQASP